MRKCPRTIILRRRAHRSWTATRSSAWDPARKRYGHVRAHRDWSLGRDRNQIATPRGHRLLTWSEEDGYAEVHLQNFSGALNDLSALGDEDIISKVDALEPTSGRRIQEPLPVRHVRFAD